MKNNFPNPTVQNVFSYRETKEKPPYVVFYKCVRCPRKEPWPFFDQERSMAGPPAGPAAARSGLLLRAQERAPDAGCRRVGAFRWLHCRGHKRILIPWQPGR